MRNKFKEYNQFSEGEFKELWENCIFVFDAKSSLKYEKITDERYKESKNNNVFQTWRSINGQKETFEVHFDTQKNKLGNIYLVKQL